LTVDVCQRSARRLFAVWENAQFENLGPEPFYIVWRVAGAYSEQDQITSSACADFPAVYGYARIRNALDDRSHMNLPGNRYFVGRRKSWVGARKARKASMHLPARHACSEYRSLSSASHQADLPARLGSPGAAFARLLVFLH
jgi:hypothetical protein